MKFIFLQKHYVTHPIIQGYDAIFQGNSREKQYSKGNEGIYNVNK